MKYVLHFGPESLHVEMEGVFSFDDTRSFHRMLSAIKANDSRSCIRVNMRRLESMDSTALRLFMMAHDAAKRNHRPLIFENAKGNVLKLLNEAAKYNALNIAS